MNDGLDFEGDGDEGVAPTIKASDSSGRFITEHDLRDVIEEYLPKESWDSFRLYWEVARGAGWSTRLDVDVIAKRLNEVAVALPKIQKRVEKGFRRN